MFFPLIISFFFSVSYLGASTLLLSSDSTPLMLAAEKGDTEEVKSLIDSGVNIEEQDQFGQTALTYAATAIKDKSFEVINLLLEKSANPNHVAKNGATPLMLIASTPYWVEGNCSYRSFDLLVDKGADLNARMPGYKKNSIVGSLIADDCFRKNAKLLRSNLIFNSVEEYDRDETTLAHLIVQLMPVEMVSFAIDYGMSPNIIDVNGITLLGAAAFNGQFKEMMNFLINKGIDVNIKDKWGVPALGRLMNRYNQPCNLEVLEYARYLVNEVGASPTFMPSMFNSNCYRDLTSVPDMQEEVYLFLKEMHSKGASLNAWFGIGTILRSNYLPSIEYVFSNINPRENLGNNKEPVCQLTSLSRNLGDQNYLIALNLLSDRGIELNIPCEPLADVAGSNNLFSDLLSRGAKVSYLKDTQNWYKLLRSQTVSNHILIETVDINFLKTLAELGLSNNMFVAIAENILKEIQPDFFNSYQARKNLKTILGMASDYSASIKGKTLTNLTAKAESLWKSSASITSQSRDRELSRKEFIYFKDLIKVVMERTPSPEDLDLACNIVSKVDINSGDFAMTRVDRSNFYNFKFLVCGT